MLHQIRPKIIFSFMHPLIVDMGFPVDGVVM
jgi:hypothetical protein